MRHIIACALSTVAIAAMTGSAVAQDAKHADPALPEPAEPDNKSRARALYREGLTHAERAEWTEAHAKFIAAEQLYSHPTNTFNQALCEKALGRYVTAMGTLAKLLETAAGAEHAELRTAAEGHLAELKSRIARLSVIAEPPIATIAVDGRVVTRQVTLDPGHHTVRVEAGGYRTEFLDVTLRAGETRTTTIRLERLPAVLSVDASVKGARVLIDGREVGRTPWRGERAGGRYRVEVMAAGYDTYASELAVLSGDKAELNAKLTVHKPSIVTRWWFWSAIGAVVAGAAVGTYFATRPEPPPADYRGGSLGWVVTF
jgi:hypothetical protein